MGHLFSAESRTRRRWRFRRTLPGLLSVLPVLSHTPEPLPGAGPPAVPTALWSSHRLTQASEPLGSSFCTRCREGPTPFSPRGKAAFPAPVLVTQVCDLTPSAFPRLPPLGTRLVGDHLAAGSLQEAKAAPLHCACARGGRGPACASGNGGRPGPRSALLEVYGASPGPQKELQRHRTGRCPGAWSRGPHTCRDTCAQSSVCRRRGACAREQPRPP